MPIYTEMRAESTNGYLPRNEKESPERRKGEFEFLIGRARKNGGPILELACGAGRMMMTFAKAGFEVYGLDASWPMLKLGLAARDKLSEGVQRRMHFIMGDMRQFYFRKQFPLIVIPFHSFWYNLEANDGGAQACLECIMENLQKRGTFIIDLPLSTRMHLMGQLEPKEWWQDMARKLGFEFELTTYIEGQSQDWYDPEDVLVGRKVW